MGNFFISNLNNLCLRANSDCHTFYPSKFFSSQTKRDVIYESHLKDGISGVLNRILFFTLQRKATPATFSWCLVFIFMIFAELLLRLYQDKSFSFVSSYHKTHSHFLSYFKFQRGFTWIRSQFKLMMMLSLNDARMTTKQKCGLKQNG